MVVAVSLWHGGERRRRRALEVNVLTASSGLPDAEFVVRGAREFYFDDPPSVPRPLGDEVSADKRYRLELIVGGHAEQEARRGYVAGDAEPDRSGLAGGPRPVDASEEPVAIVGVIAIGALVHHQEPIVCALGIEVLLDDERALGKVQIGGGLGIDRSVQIGCTRVDMHVDAIGQTMRRGEGVDVDLHELGGEHMRALDDLGLIEGRGLTRALVDRRGATRAIRSSHRSSHRGRRACLTHAATIVATCEQRGDQSKSQRESNGHGHGHGGFRTPCSTS